MTAPTIPASLLTDPATVALLRDLHAHARHINATHHTFAFVNFDGRPYGPLEHTWAAGSSRVVVEDGRLLYKRHGVKILDVEVTTVRQAAQVLAAIGVLPQRYAGGAR